MTSKVVKSSCLLKKGTNGEFAYDLKDTAVGLRVQGTSQLWPVALPQEWEGGGRLADGLCCCSCSQAGKWIHSSASQQPALSCL